jgi:hypothetical protein
MLWVSKVELVSVRGAEFSQDCGSFGEGACRDSEGSAEPPTFLRLLRS